MSSKIKTAVSAYAVNPAVKKGIPMPVAPHKGLTTAQVAAATAAQPQPWDANYETAISNDATTAANDNAAIDNQITAAKQAYGFDDTSNPFSKIALLQESYANAQRGNTNSAAASGQLYAGSLNNAQDASTHSYNENYDATRRDYDATLSGLAARKTQVNNTQTDNDATADWNRTQTALANRPDPTTLPVPAPTSSLPAGVTATPGKDSAGNPGTWHVYPDGHKVFVRSK